MSKIERIGAVRRDGATALNDMESPLGEIKQAAATLDFVAEGLLSEEHNYAASSLRFVAASLNRLHKELEACWAIAKGCDPADYGDS